MTLVDSRQIVIHDLYPRLNYGALIFWPFLSTTTIHATIASRRMHHLYLCVILNSTAELMIYLMHPHFFTVRNFVGMSSRTQIFLEVAVLICKNRIYFVFYQKKYFFEDFLVIFFGILSRTNLSGRSITTKKQLFFAFSWLCFVENTARILILNKPNNSVWAPNHKKRQL